MQTFKYHIYRPALVTEKQTVTFEAENEEHSLKILENIISGDLWDIDIEYDNDFITYTSNEVDVYDNDRNLILAKDE